MKKEKHKFKNIIKKAGVVMKKVKILLNLISLVLSAFTLGLIVSQLFERNADYDEYDEDCYE